MQFVAMLEITAEPKVYGYSFSPNNPSSSSNSFSTSPTIPDSHTFPFQGFLEEETRCRKILLFVGNASHSNKSKCLVKASS